MINDARTTPRIRNIVSIGTIQLDDAILFVFILGLVIECLEKDAVLNNSSKFLNGLYCAALILCNIQ